MQDIWLGCKLSSLLRFVLDLNQSGLKTLFTPFNIFKVHFHNDHPLFCRKNKAMCTGCYSVSYRLWSEVPLRDPCLNSRLSFIWMPLSMRSTGSGTTFTQRQTSMTFQVLIFLQSPLSKTDTFATATKFPSYRESLVNLRE